MRNELTHRRFWGLLALIASTSLLVVAAYLGNWLAGICLIVMAQAITAISISYWQGTRQIESWKALGQQLGLLLLLWASALSIASLLLVWPIKPLFNNGSLLATLGLSAIASAIVLALWQIWPLWQGLERKAESLNTLWGILPRQARSAWRGLLIVFTICTILTGALLILFWLDWQSIWHKLIVAAYAVLLPLLHGTIQRITPATILPVLPEQELIPITVANVLDELGVNEEDLSTQLYEAARTGKTERALILLEAGAPIDALPAEDWDDQRSLVVLASILPDLSLLRELIIRGVDINMPFQGNTPLLAATDDSSRGRPDAVMTLLANGADSRIADAQGNTPLHHAACSADPGIAALLLDAAAQVNQINNDGLSPLALACKTSNWRLARFLLGRGAKVAPADGVPVLLTAASIQEDDPVGVEILFKYKARVNALDTHRRSALHEAAKCGHEEIAAVLLAAGADLTLCDDKGRTPWLEAARHGQATVMEKLLSYHPDIAATDAQGCNAITLACKAERTTVALIQRLQAMGVDNKQPDNDGQLAVEVAARAGRWALVVALDPGYALLAAVSSEGAIEDDDTPPPATVTKTAPPEIATAPLVPLQDKKPLEALQDNLQQGHTKGLQELALFCTIRELSQLLHDPKLVKSPHIIHWLLQQGASPQALNTQNDTPLFALLKQGLSALTGINAFLQQAIPPTGAGGLAYWLTNCLQQNLSETDSNIAQATAITLLEQGADPFDIEPLNEPLLFAAVRLNWVNLQQTLLQRGIASVQTVDNHGMSALHLAASLGHKETIKNLIFQGANPQLRAVDGQTPLGVALANGRRDLSIWLEWHTWPLPLRPLQNIDLVNAASKGDTDAVKRLLELGISPDAVDEQGCTALLRAAAGGHVETIKCLLEHGANPQRASDSGATPLSAAISMRQIHIVAALIKANVDIEYRLPGGATALMLASALGLPEISTRLLAAKADVHASNSHGLTALHCAARYGCTAQEKARLLTLLDTLLLTGARADEICVTGNVTPLLLLLGARIEPGTTTFFEDVILAGVERLLEEGVNLKMQDARGYGPLHLAALHGFLSVVRRLLHAGADPNLRDHLNRTPAEIAVMRGFIDVAAELAASPVPGKDSLTRFLRDR